MAPDRCQSAVCPLSSWQRWLAGGNHLPPQTRTAAAAGPAVAQPRCRQRPGVGAVSINPTHTGPQPAPSTGEGGYITFSRSRSHPSPRLPLAAAAAAGGWVAAVRGPQPFRADILALIRPCFVLWGRDVHRPLGWGGPNRPSPIFQVGLLLTMAGPLDDGLLQPAATNLLHLPPPCLEQVFVLLEAKQR